MPLQGPLPTNLAALEASELLDAQAYASLLSVEDDSTQPSFVVSMLQLYISDSAELLAEIQGELQGPPDAPLPVDAAMRADLTTHKLKGSSATMGLPKVAEACCSLRESLVCSLSSEPRREALRKLEVLKEQYNNGALLFNAIINNKLEIKRALADMEESSASHHAARPDSPDSKTPRMR